MKRLRNALLALLAMPCIALAGTGHCAEAEGLALEWSAMVRLRGLFHRDLALPHLVIHEDAGSLRRSLKIGPENKVAGYFRPEALEIHVACLENGERVFERVLRHEVAHYYLHETFASPSRWMEEGVASYLEVGPLQDGPMAAHVNPGRLREFRSLLKRGQVSDLEDVFRKPADAFLQSDDYAMAWALTYALLHHPEPEVQARRRQCLSRMLRAADALAAYRILLEEAVHDGGDARGWETNWRREIWRLPLTPAGGY
jgi:hypothetical protein